MDGDIGVIFSSQPILFSKLVRDRLLVEPVLPEYYSFHGASSKIELVVSIIESTELPITIVIDVYENRERRLNMLSEARTCNTAKFPYSGLNN